MRFDDRRHAGVLLGRAVAALAPLDPVVYGLPRGGVPVAYEVARALGCPLDVVIVRKVGVPYQPELAMGAIAEGGVTTRNEEILSLTGIDEALFEEVAARQRVEIEKRVAAYRGDTRPLPPEGHTAIVVDDGLATGSTAIAAVSVLEQLRARSVWLAVPVAPASPVPGLDGRVERMVVLSRPRGFGAVGSWYRDFTQTTDDEVRELLESSRLP
ncbi:MAG: phosphoribosyltransferase family protein [Acidimicrobiia bacterium]